MITLPAIEYDIVDHCNLNCRNCGHFSPFKSKGEKSIDQITKDVQLLCRKFQLERFNIAGGEPLLHSKIISVLSVIRKAVGENTAITLTTNGVKIKGMGETFCIFVKHLKVKLVISKYPIGVDYNDLAKTLEMRGVPFTFELKNSFYNFLDPTGIQDSEESFRLCKSENCPFYDGENIYSCAYVSNVPFVNQKFGYNIQRNVISINESPEAIKRYLDKPSLTCKFCKASRQPEPWQRLV